MRFGLAIGFFLGSVLMACGGTSEPPTAPAPPPIASDPSPSAAMPPAETLSSEECTARGGSVRGDIGDGQIACAPTERELGRVRVGVESGVCCAAQPAAQPPLAPDPMP